MNFKTQEIPAYVGMTVLKKLLSFTRLTFKLLLFKFKKHIKRC